MSESEYQTVVQLLPRLRRFAYGLCGSMEAAEDLVQEACTRLLASAGDKEGYLDRWLFRTIRNLHVDGLRSRLVSERYRHRLVQAENDQRVGSRHTEASIELDEVRALMRRLPPEQREVLLLIGVEGFSYRECSRMLDLPIGTVTSRVARARRQLVRWMTSDPKDDEP